MLLKRIRIRVNAKENTAKSKIFYDDTLGILREETTVVQVRYVASPTIVLRKTKRALQNANGDTTENKIPAKVVVG